MKPRPDKGKGKDKTSEGKGKTDKGKGKSSHQSAYDPFGNPIGDIRVARGDDMSESSGGARMIRFEEMMAKFAQRNVHDLPPAPLPPSLPKDPPPGRS